MEWNGGFASHITRHLCQLGRSGGREGGGEEDDDENETLEAREEEREGTDGATKKKCEDGKGSHLPIFSAGGGRKEGMKEREGEKKHTAHGTHAHRVPMKSSLQGTGCLRVQHGCLKGW